MKGNDWTVVGNHGVDSPTDGYQVHEILEGWGTGNVFEHNVADVNGAGYGFYVHGEMDSNRIACNNEVTGAAKGAANVACR
ncbi:MAG: hypothetical protein ACRD0U_15890 [Acidimicrobiales bacterium]